MTGQHLSAAGAAWAVAALALNTAAQDCDYDLWGPKWNYLLRATPWGCCLDAVHLMYILCVDTRAHGSFRAALRVAESIRGPGEPSNRTRRRIYLEAIVLAAAISQLVKLMVTSGIPAIRALAMVYTFTYALQLLVNASSARTSERSLPMNELPWISSRRQLLRVEEQLRVLQDHVAEQDKHDRDRVARRPTILVIITGSLAVIACACGLLIIAIRFEDESPPKAGHDKQPGWLVWTNMSLLLLTVTWLALNIISTYESPSVEYLKIPYRLRVHSAPSALILGITVYRSALRQSKTEGTVSHLSPHTPLWFVTIAIALGFYALYVLIVQKPYSAQAFIEHEDKFIRLAVPLSVLANVGTVAFYFAAFYDPQATTKPSWADYLG